MKKIILTLASIVTSIVLFAQPKVVGHRGCRDVEGQFENTVRSLKYAQQVGVDAVEFDVQLTSDNKVIVFHGPYLPGDNTKSIHDMTFEQARAYKLPWEAFTFDQTK